MSLLSRARRALVPSYQTLVRRTHDLRYLFVELTHDCNLRCRHCGSDCIRDSGQPPLEAEALLKVLREIREHHDPHHICLALTGGEPLCYPGLFELGAQIHRLEFPWGMVTNGYAFNADTIDRAKRAGMDSVTVSLDGFAQAHDWLRGRSGSHRRALAAIRLLMADRFWQGFDVVTCVNPNNLDQLEALYEQLDDLEVPGWRLFTISPIGRAAELPELFLSAEQYHRLMAKVTRLRKRDGMPVALSESGYHGRDHELQIRGEYFFCRAGINVAGIMVNGDMLACPNIDRRFRQGNIHQDSFVETWRDRYEDFRDRGWMKVGQCETCSQWSMCQGNSFHLWDLDERRSRLCHCDAYQLAKRR